MASRDLVRVTGSTTLTVTKDGKDAVSWRVVPSVSSVGVRRGADGSLTPDVAGVSVRVTRTVGDGTPSVIDMDDWAEWLVDVWYRWVGESDAQWKSYPMTPVSVNTAKKGLEFRLTIANKEADRVTVPFVFDGEQGQTGGRGAILRGPRRWEEVLNGADFQNGKGDAEFFDVVVYNGSFYSCKANHAKALLNFPGSAPDQSLGLWQSAANFAFVATDLLLAKYALIENLGVASVEMKNESGLTVCTIKDGVIEILSGTFKGITVQNASLTNCRVSGSLTANTLSLGCEDAATLDLGATVDPKGSLLVNPSSVKLVSLVKGTSRSLRLIYPQLTSTEAHSLTLTCSGAANTFVHNGVGGTAQASLTIQSSDLMIGRMYELLGVNSTGITHWYLIEM